MPVRQQLAQLSRAVALRRGRLLPLTAAQWLVTFPHGPAGLTAAPALRPYQAEPAAAILRSVREGLGLSFSVMMSRQAGKNELSAQLELALLAEQRRRAIDAVKTAPTLSPQLHTSLRRLAARAADVGIPAHQREGTVEVGRARLVALSAEPSANVVGATAGLLLEVDEAQDVDAEVFDKRFRPMGATTNVTTVYYGTAWSETDLLASVAREHLALEARDGIRRHFAADWQTVARHNPAYAAYVEAERQRLGEDHPLFTTQYLLRPLAGAGRMFSAGARDALHGSHARADGPVTPRPGRLLGYAGGLDVGGEAITAGRGADSTVLAIGAVYAPEPGALSPDPTIDVVQLYAWQGAPHADLSGILSVLIRDRWRLTRLVVDATGMGEGLASSLAQLRGGPEVIRVRLTEQRKSELGYGLQAAAGSRLRLWRSDGSAEWAEALHEAGLARVEYRPNRVMRWSVPVGEGHDDYLMALALCVEAARELAPRTARGRVTE